MTIDNVSGSPAPVTPKPVEAPVQAPAPAPVAAPKPTPKVFGDEFSTGRGAALRAQSAKYLAGDPAPMSSAENVKATVAGVDGSTAADPIERAQEDFDQLDTELRVGSPAHTARVAELIAANPDQAYRSELLALLNDHQQLDVTGATTRQSLTPEQQATFREALQGALDDGTITAADMRAFTTGPNAAHWRAINIELDPTASAQMKAVNQAVAAKDKATAKVDELNQTLATELAAMGPALTDEQKQAYIKAFRKEHDGEYAEENAASAELARLLADPATAAALETIGSRSPEEAKKVYAAYKTAAENPEGGEAAVNWCARLLSEPPSELYLALSEGDPGFDERIQKEIVGPAFASAAGKYMSQAATPEAGVEQIKKLAERLEAVGKLADSREAIQAGVATFKELAAGNYKAIESYATAFGGKSPLFASMAGVAVLVGSLSVKSELDANNFLGATKAITKLGADGLVAVSGGLGLLAQTARFAKVSGTATRASEIAARYVPGLNLIANALAFADSSNKFLHDKSVGRGLTALGDLISLGSSAFGPWGEVGVAVGGIVGALGTATTAFEDIGKFWGEIDKVCGDAGFDLSTVMGSSRWLSDRGAQDALAMGLTPQQVQALFANPQTNILFNANFQNFTAFTRLATAYGLKGEQVTTFLAKMMEEGSCAAATAELREIQDQLRLEGLDPESMDYRIALRDAYAERHPELAQWATLATASPYDT